MSNFFYEYINGKGVRVDLEKGEKIPLKGKRVSSLLKENKKFNKKEIFFITKQLLEILGEMRSVYPPVLHKNISPSSIIIKKGWEIGLIEFNSKNPNENYAAPEASSFPTPKSDLYSVGKVLQDLSKNNIPDDNFNKFISLMTDNNPNNRFKDIKSAKSIFKKIEDNSISEEDWDTPNPESKSLNGVSTISRQEINVRNDFESSLDNLDYATYSMNHRNRPRSSKGVVFGWLFAVPLMMYITYINTKNDDGCRRRAPAGYYNDKECKLHKKTADFKKKEILRRNQQDKALRKKWKDSGLTKKIK